MLTNVAESSDIPAAPQVARKPHTTGATNAITNGNHPGAGGVTKNVDFAPATNTLGGVNTIST